MRSFIIPNLSFALLVAHPGQRFSRPQTPEFAGSLKNERTLTVQNVAKLW
jgi:hypothetical protein